MIWVLLKILVIIINCSTNIMNVLAKKILYVQFTCIAGSSYNVCSLVLYQICISWVSNSNLWSFRGLILARVVERRKREGGERNDNVEIERRCSNKRGTQKIGGWCRYHGDDNSVNIDPQRAGMYQTRWRDYFWG